MWTVRHSFPRDSEIRKTEFWSGEHALSFGEVIAGWKDSWNFRSFFIAELASAPFAALFWEARPVRRDHLGDAYQHVIIPGDALAAMRPDVSAFASEFLGLEMPISVATFRNLGGDAVLVAPRPVADANCYGHLAAFLRLAPAEQKDALFQALGEAAERVLAENGEPIWISTSGLGVPWLHIRLDSLPKYYNYEPYRAG